MGMFCGLLFVLLTSVLSVLLRFTDSDYPFDIFSLLGPLHIDKLGQISIFLVIPFGVPFMNMLTDLTPSSHIKETN